MKRFKKEIYYLWKLFNPKYSPVCKFNLKCYFNYFKNKFFGNFFASTVPSYKFSPDNDFELHMLSQRGNLWMSIWSLRSFLIHSKLHPKIIIHNDGSMNKRAINILKEKFNGLDVISRQEADNLIFNRLKLSDRIKQFRKSDNNLLLKLIDIPLFARGNKIMLMGDDVLFFNKPQEIIDFVDGKISCRVLVSKNDGNYDMGVKEEYLKKYKLKEKKADFINSDLILFYRDCITVEALEEYFANTLMGSDFYFLEMAGLSCILAQSDFAFLPLDKYHIKGPITDKTVMKHFTSPRRQELYAYGIDKARESIL